MYQDFKECIIGIMQHPIMEKPISQLPKSDCEKAYCLLRVIRDESMEGEALFDSFQLARLEVQLGDVASAITTSNKNFIIHYKAVPHLLQEGGLDLSLQKWSEVADPSRPRGQVRHFEEDTRHNYEEHYEDLLQHPILRKPIYELAIGECQTAFVLLADLVRITAKEWYTQVDYIQMARLRFTIAELTIALNFACDEIIEYYKFPIILLNKGGIDLSLKKWMELASLRSTSNPDIPDE